MEEGFKKTLLRIVTNRLLILSILIFAMFYALVAKLFDLQIINGQFYDTMLSATYRESVRLPAPRGTICDRYGRPLAINESAYAVKLNPGAQPDNLNAAILNLANLLEKNGEQYEIGFPISRTKPYAFMFNNSASRESRWKADMNVGKDAAPDEVIAQLRERFEIPDAMSENDAWKVIAFRSLIYINRNNLHIPITIASDVKQGTVIMIEEHNEQFQSFYVDVEPLREYPGEGYVSHIVGYISKVTDKEYEDNKDKGYTMTDNIGKTGLERAFERDFKGADGEQVVEMSQNGRPVNTVSVTLPVSGGKLFTTIDLDFQKKVYHILEDQLKTVLKKKMQGVSSRESPITQRQLFSKMIKSNNISVQKIMESQDGDDAYSVKTYVLNILPDFDPQAEKAFDDVKNVVAEGIEIGKITSKQMLLVMMAQGILTGDDKFADNIRAGRLGTLQVILDKMDEGEITPQMTSLDPCTGSVVVVDVATGGVLASVNYPTYDNNQFVNYFNNNYYYKLYDDPTTPMNNRAFMEPRAPGSTFKMISAIAGLESGVINANTRIFDELTFTKVGRPFARCWSSSSHGLINVVQALEGSCNYFFSEVAYRMINTKNSGEAEAITTLNKYMIEFGLNERSGVEIGEFRDTLTDENDEVIPLAISSPQYKAYIEGIRHPDAERLDPWVAGDTIRTAFGQANNNYTSAVMAKYIATLASRGIRRDLHFMNRLEDQSGHLIKSYEPEKETLIDVDPSNLEVVYNGMLRVNTTGTARTVFSDFPVTVAGKTGTAQESPIRNDHASYGGFAPFNDPQIAVYVTIPYGDTKVTVPPAAAVAREVIAEYMGLNNEPEYAQPTHRLTQ